MTHRLLILLPATLLAGVLLGAGPPGATAVDPASPAPATHSAEPLKNEVKRAYQLGDPDRTELEMTTDKGVRIVQTPPHYAPNVIASVVVAVEIQGEAAER